MIKILLLTSLTEAVLDLIYHRIEVQMFARLSGQPALPLLINKYLFERRTNITTSGYAFFCLTTLEWPKLGLNTVLTSPYQCRVSNNSLNRHFSPENQ